MIQTFNFSLILALTGYVLDLYSGVLEYIILISRALCSYHPPKVCLLTCIAFMIESISRKPSQC